MTGSHLGGSRGPAKHPEEEVYGRSLRPPETVETGTGNDVPPAKALPEVSNRKADGKFPTVYFRCGPEVVGVGYQRQPRGRARLYPALSVKLADPPQKEGG